MLCKGNMLIPRSFNVDGLLDAGTYEATFAELRASVLVAGPAGFAVSGWDVGWRSRLVGNAQILVDQLWQVGITTIFLDGSFAEAKPRPNDIDGYFECDLRRFASGALQQDLNRLDPHKVWTWDRHSRRPAAGSTKRELPMWHRYRVELYPHFAGLLSGIRDQAGNELPFPSAFRQHRGTGLSKGIVRIIQGR